MHPLRFASIQLLLIVLLLACTPAAPQGSSQAQPGSAPRAGAQGRTLVMIARGEPPSLAVKPLQGAGGIGNINPIFNATLDHADERGARHPLLAEALPQLNSDTWRVFPDGRMETTHRLRPNLAWHDGTELSAEDFVFALRVYATPALGVSGSPPISEMEEVQATDPRTVVIRWRRAYPEAGGMREDFQPLPRHILEQPLLQGDADAFANHPFWTHEYVGLGPFRVDRWEPGAAIESVAFDGYALGRPKIDRMRIIFMGDTNTALANLLSGDAHIAIDFVLMYEQGAILQREWAPSQGGTVLLSPILYRNSLFQFRPEMMATPAMLDVRFRRALVHAFDKQAVNDALIGGHAILVEGLLSPLSDYWPAIEPHILKHAYDTRRAQQLLDEVGLQRGADGFYLGPDRQPFRFEIRVIANPTQESENAIMVEGYRRLGIDAAGLVFPVAQLRDGQAVATFSGLHTTGGSGFERDMGRWSSAAVRRPENRWQGTNSGGYTNAAFDRLWESYNQTLDRSERIQQLAQMERIITEELPAIPHYYTPIVTAHVAALTGPVARTSRDAVEVVRLHEWAWR
jgi:ABC-type transport system substrate-binding protein